MSICGRIKNKRNQEQNHKIRRVEDESCNNKNNFKLYRKHDQCRKWNILYKPKQYLKKSLSSKRIQNNLLSQNRPHKKIHNRLDRYDRKKYAAKKKKLCQDHNVAEKVLILAKRMRKKSAPGKFYKQTVQNIPYFNKKETFIMRNKQKIDKNTYYWVKNSKSNTFLIKRFQRHKRLLLKTIFLCK